VYNPGLFTDAAETALGRELDRIAPLFNELWSADRYTDLFVLLRDLRPFVDVFFSEVMVMCEEEKIRANRLNVLQALVNRLGKLADFAALQM